MCVCVCLYACKCVCLRVLTIELFYVSINFYILVLGTLCQ